MQMSILRVLSLVLAACFLMSPQGAQAKGLLQRSAQAKGPTTGMAGLEGEACSSDEYERYKSIVCALSQTCTCGATKCALDWCFDYIFEKKKEFGACTLKGCP
mmetsp:Transcript_108443/g.203545  ORF Transcript_108443/g.203545 Transcript_108443/m.203545 type:complete len:103 (+) Transcript_108443:55-363(+)